MQLWCGASARGGIEFRLENRGLDALADLRASNRADRAEDRAAEERARPAGKTEGPADGGASGRADGLVEQLVSAAANRVEGANIDRFESLHFNFSCKGFGQSVKQVACHDSSRVNLSAAATRVAGFMAMTNLSGGDCARMIAADRTAREAAELVMMVDGGDGVFHASPRRGSETTRGSGVLRRVSLFSTRKFDHGARQP